MEYETVSKVEWRIAVGGLSQLGVIIKPIPNSVVKTQGVTTLVGKNLHDLVVGVLAKEVDPEVLKWYLAGLRDMTAAIVADENEV